MTQIPAPEAEPGPPPSPLGPESVEALTALSTDLRRPRLRPLAAESVRHHGREMLALSDPLGAFEGTFLIPLGIATQVLRRFDGTTPLETIAEQVGTETGRALPIEDVIGLVRKLDEALLLDGPAFADFQARYRSAKVRDAALAGRSYPDSPTQLRRALDGYFLHPRGVGRIAADRGSEIRPTSPSLRAVLCPHIDFGRGGPIYTHAYRALLEQNDADTFIILGVAHQGCRNRFALTRKDFATPLGTVATDRDYIDALAGEAGMHLFDDELTHRTEHSIEFQAVWLQHLLGDRRPFRIVPVLVGSFHDLMWEGAEPIEAPEVARFVAALRSVEARLADRKVAYIGSIDLGHIGQEFGDPGPLDDCRLDRLRVFDDGLLDRAEACDPRGWFACSAATGDRDRTCGLAATYTLMHAIGPARGHRLAYHQAVNPERTCCVSFTSLVFERADG